MKTHHDIKIIISVARSRIKNVKLEILAACHWLFKTINLYVTVGRRVPTSHAFICIARRHLVINIVTFKLNIYVLSLEKILITATIFNFDYEKYIKQSVIPAVTNNDNSIHASKIFILHVIKVKKLMIM